MKHYEIATAIRADLLAGTATEEARAEYRYIRKTYAAERDALVTMHGKSYSPAETVADLVEAIGYDNAAEIVAIMVIAKGTWDERISAKVRAWAGDLVTITPDEIRDVLELYYSDSIHPAHMDQIARAMMKYTPAETETAEAPAESPAEATESAEATETTDSTPETESPAETETEPAETLTPYERVIAKNPECKNAWRLPGYPFPVYGVIYYDQRGGQWTCYFPTLEEFRDEIEKLTNTGYTIERTTRTEAGETVDFPIEETEAEPATVPVLDLLDDLDTGNHGDRLNDYRDSTAYIGDAIAEIADADTSIYYADILDFVRENPDTLADVIAEGLYDPAHNYDFYKHAQAAEYMTIERDIYDHLADSLMVAAVHFLRYDLDVVEIPEELADLLREWCDAADSDDRMNEIPDKIREYLDDFTEEVTA